MAASIAALQRDASQLAVTITYDSLSFSVDVDPVSEGGGLPSLPKALWRFAESAVRWVTRRPSPATKFAVLRGLCGRLRAGTSTIIIGSPGSGTSTFLRLLSGRVAPQERECLRFNGLTAEALYQQGIDLCRLAGYAPERDAHEPLLTVKETLSFIYNVAVDARQQGLPVVPAAAPEPPAATTASSPPGDAVVEAAQPPDTSPAAALPAIHTPQQVMDVMGLAGVANSRVGSQFVRGISGGQRRRLTCAETLLQSPRILALDNISVGLDALTALQVVDHIVRWGRQTNATIVAALTVSTQLAGVTSCCPYCRHCE